jgi:hypothetical protein
MSTRENPSEVDIVSDFYIIFSHSLITIVVFLLFLFFVFEGT